MTSFFILNKFQEYLEFERRFSTHTSVAYIKDVEQFLFFTQMDENSIDLKETSHQIVRAWIVSLLENKIENKSVNRKLSSLRTFFNWCKKMQYVEVNPLTKIKSLKVSKSLPVFAKETEVNSIDGFFDGGFSGVRDRLMFELFYQTGIRLSELINLRQENISTESIKVLGKRNKERVIPISKELYKMISDFIFIKKENNIENIYLLVLDNGNKLYEKFVYRKINNYLGLLTTMDKQSPHVLRHTFATHMLNNGSDLSVLKDILGHSSLAATQVYTHNSFVKLKSIYSQAHPRGSKID